MSTRIMNENLEQRRDRAERRMDRAWIAGLIHALIFGVIGGLMAVSVGFPNAVDLIPFGYGLVIALLAIGTHRRNRFAATALLLVALLVEGGIWWKNRSLIELVILIVFCPLYAFGLWGAIAWHRLKTESGNLTAPAT
jgi:hypothetical protein